MNLNQKDIILLPYPFTDLEGSKVRPAVVISNNNFNRKSEDIIAIPLTTVLKDEPHSVLIYQENLSSGKLLKPSRIRADKIFTVYKNLAVMKIGVINEKTFRELKSKIFKIIM